MRIKETIIVEGRDDTRAIRDSIEAVTIETHGYGIRPETWELIDKAYNSTGIIVFTDPDHAGEQIRKRITDRFPEARQAYLDRDLAEKQGDIGIENASPESIREALSKARCTVDREIKGGFTAEDMVRWGLNGGKDSATKRKLLGKKLGTGFANSKTLLKRINGFGITEEEILRALGEE